MSYHGYLPLLKQFLSLRTEGAAFLEVGVDRGVTFIPLVAFLSAKSERFAAVGIDVKVQESLAITLHNLELGNNYQLIEENSLEALPRLVGMGIKFDLILIDGDHNYHTVKEELKYAAELLQPSGLMIIDDYDGKWSERDLWYAERPGYEDTKATKPVETEKQGVKAAVDEFLAANTDWYSLKVMKGEPILLHRSALEIKINDVRNEQNG